MLHKAWSLGRYGLISKLYTIHVMMRPDVPKRCSPVTGVSPHKPSLAVTPASLALFYAARLWSPPATHNIRAIVSPGRSVHTMATGGDTDAETIPTPTWDQQRGRTSIEWREEMRIRRRLQVVLAVRKLSESLL